MEKRKLRVFFIITLSVLLLLTNACTQPLTAHERWHTFVGEHVLAAPLFTQNGDIYVGAQSGNIYVYHPDGTLVRQFQVPGEISADLVGDPYGTIYIATKKGFLYAYHPDGSLRWTFQTDGPLVSGPVVFFSSTLYFASLTGTLYALNLDGSLYWKKSLQGGALAHPTVAYGIVYVGTDKGFLYSFTLWGEPHWSTPAELSLPLATIPIVSTDGHVYIGSNTNKIFAILPHGHKLWEYDLDSPPQKYPFIDPYDTATFVSTSHHLYNFQVYGFLENYLLKADKGTDTSLAKTTFSQEGSFPAPDGRFYYFDQKRNLNSLEATGKLRWQFEVPVYPQSALSMSPNYTLYFVGEDLNLYAIRERGAE